MIKNTVIKTSLFDQNILHLPSYRVATVCKTTKKGKQERQGTIPEGTNNRQEMVMTLTTKWGINNNRVFDYETIS